MTTTHHLPAGKAANGPRTVHISPEPAGRGHSSLRVPDPPAGGWHSFDTGDHTWIRATWPDQPVDRRLPRYPAPSQ
ncbi:hypothetical protein AB0D78_03120 [Streptomyces avermitilis]|uniref:hypothetical protein n=1 Tax=Streptomyces avermitilis TaxID=33903 RepID=UPI0033AC3E2A